LRLEPLTLLELLFEIFDLFVNEYWSPTLIVLAPTGTGLKTEAAFGRGRDLEEFFPENAFEGPCAYMVAVLPPS